MTTAAQEVEPAPATPPTRGNLMLRFTCGALLAALVLWLPVHRVIWSRTMASAGVFEAAIVFDLDSASAQSDVDRDETAARRTAQCRYADGEHTLSFIDNSGLKAGDEVQVAYLPSTPKRAVRVAPGTNAFGIYFASESWIVDAVLWPIGAVLVLASLMNLMALRRVHSD